MKKKLHLASFLLVCIFISSCSDDKIEIEPVAVVRNTHTDMEILSRFIDVNKATNEYYINVNKKTRALSYITGADWRELEKVSPVSIEKCKNYLAVLNTEVARAIADPENAYIVFSVNGKTLVKKLRDTDVDFASSPTLNASTKTIPYSLEVYGESNISTGKFKHESPTIRMNVNLDVNDPFNCYYFQIAKPDTYPSPDNNPSIPKSVAFTGTGSLLKTSFIWTANGDAQQSDGLFQWEFKSKGSTPGSGHIARCTFSH